MKSIREQLLAFIKQNPDQIHASGELQRRYWKNKNGSWATPRSIVRRLEELCEEGYIRVEYKANHAYYSVNKEIVGKKTDYRIMKNAYGETVVVMN